MRDDTFNEPSIRISHLGLLVCVIYPLGLLLVSSLQKIDLVPALFLLISLVVICLPICVLVLWRGLTNYSAPLAALCVATVAFALPVYFGVFYASLQKLSEGACLSGADSGLDAIYFSFTTMTTLGYGEIVPLSICRIVTSFQATLGLLLMGVIPGLLLSRHLKLNSP